MDYDISVGGIFSKEAEKEPFCSVCFFASLPSGGTGEDLEEHIAKSVLPELARLAVAMDEEAMRKEVEAMAAQIREQYGVECTGYLNEYLMSIIPKGAVLDG